MTSVAVTGADGFIGVAVCAVLEAQGMHAIRIVRSRKGRARIGA